MTYSGRLTESSGAPKDGPVAIEATFWTAEIDGTQLGQTFEFASVILNQGVFSLYFPFMASQVQDIFRDGTEPVFIEISSGGKAYPRQKFNYIPLAMRIPVDNKSVGFDVTSGKLGITGVKDAASGSVLVSNGAGGVKWDNLSSANLTAKTEAGASPLSDQVLTFKSGKWVAASLPPAAASGNYLTGLTGDIEATGPGSGTATLASVAIPGTATKVTFDAKGRITSGTSLAPADINGALGFVPISADSTDILTNKTLSGATINGASTIGGLTTITTTGAVTTGVLTASTVRSQGNVTVQGNGINANQLMLNDKTNTKYVAFKAPDTLAYQLTWELPNTNGTAGQVLSTNGNGTLSWASGVPPTGNASGDLTGEFPSPTLAAVGTAGQYMKVTTDTKGRVTSGTTLTVSDLPPISATSLNTGTLAIANGGTGVGAFSNNGVVIGSSSALSSTAAGTQYNVLTVNASNQPTFGLVNLASNNAVNGTLGVANGGTGVNSTATFPTSGVVVTRDATETLSNKTLTAPVFGTIVNTGTLTLPTTTDTLVGRATTDTLTNKTLSGATINGASSLGGSTTINTTGTATTGALTASTVTSQGSVTVQGNGTNASKLVLNDKTNTNYLALKAPDTLASQLTWELPGTNGTAGQVLSTNGTGTLSWVSGVAPTGTASGDLTGNFPGPTVATVGGKTSTAIATSVNDTVAATSAGTASTIVKRDASGNFAAGTITGTLSGNATNVTGTVAIANGGTGATTASAAFDALSPLTTIGDILYAGAGGTDTRLAGNQSTTKQFLSSTGTGTAATAPVWAALTASDIPAHSASLITSGVLGVANGGTGAATTTANYVFAGPTTGTGAPTFRTLVAGDLPAMGGANGTAAGTAGAVPGPAAADNLKFLRGDGTWATPIAVAAGSASQIQYNTGGVLTGNANFVYSGGNVGIGTSAPGAALEIKSGQLVTTLATNTATGTTYTLDFATGNMQLLNLGSATGDLTLTFSNAIPGGSYAIEIIQGTTPRLVSWPANVRWPNGIPMSLSSTANAIDLVTLFFDGTYFLAVGGKSFN